MSTTRSFVLLPFIAAALMAPATFAAPPPPAHEPVVAPKPTHQKPKHKHKKKRKAHRSADCSQCPACISVTTVERWFRPAPAPCPPDFADAWLAQARLAWTGPTRCFPFQPDQFHPTRPYTSLCMPPAVPESEVEVVGDGGFGK